MEESSIRVYWRRLLPRPLQKKFHNRTERFRSWVKTLHFNWIYPRAPTPALWFQTFLKQSGCFHGRSGITVKSDAILYSFTDVFVTLLAVKWWPKPSSPLAVTCRLSFLPFQCSLKQPAPQTLQLSPSCMFIVDPTVVTFFSSGHPAKPCGFCNYFLSCNLKWFCKRSLLL